MPERCSGREWLTARRDSVDAHGMERGASTDREIPRTRPADALVNTVGGYAARDAVGTGKRKSRPDAGTESALGLCVSRAAVRTMLKQGRGAIVNVAVERRRLITLLARRVRRFQAAAVACWIRWLRIKGSGVRVNSILPSIIDTEANRKAMPKADFAKWPKPEEIAVSSCFYAGDDARVIHGAAIPFMGIAETFVKKQI